MILDWKHTCTNPRSNEYSFSSLPRDVQKVILDRKLDKEELLRCSYCGDIWIEQRGYSEDKPPIVVGIKNLGSEDINWVILKYEH